MPQNRRVEDTHAPVYVVKASFVQWAIFFTMVYTLVIVLGVKEQFMSDMEAQQRLFDEGRKLYIEEQKQVMYDILASKLKEMRISIDVKNEMLEEVCLKPQ